MKPESHEYADMFPMLEGKDLQSLANDIKSNGQNEPIIIYEGKILDGRNRYAACELAGVEPITREFDGTDALSFVISQNLHRRHLSESQRGMVGAMIANLQHGEMGNGRKVDSAIALSKTPVTQKSAAEMLNIGVDSIKRSKTVMRDGIPELIKAVETGQVAVTRAARIAKLPPEEQAGAMKEPTPKPKNDSIPDSKPKSYSRTKVIESNGMAIYSSAKSVMDRLNKNDTEFNKSLQAMVTYCKNRITQNQ